MAKNIKITVEVNVENSINPAWVSGKVEAFLKNLNELGVNSIKINLHKED